MGYRFSIYLILYLLLFVNVEKKEAPKDIKMNLISFSFITLILFNLKNIFH
jgi:hypothetical protein